MGPPEVVRGGYRGGQEDVPLGVNGEGRGKSFGGHGKGGEDELSALPCLRAFGYVPMG